MRFMDFTESPDGLRRPGLLSAPDTWMFLVLSPPLLPFGPVAQQQRRRYFSCSATSIAGLRIVIPAINHAEIAPCFVVVYIPSLR